MPHTLCQSCKSGGSGGADPLVRAGPPGHARLSKNQVIASLDKPARGPAADQGVRPISVNLIICFFVDRPVYWA